MPRIFISYRRDDSPAHAGRLYDELRNHFGEHAVYRDVDSMKPGIEFVDRIERELASAAAVVVVIGDSWLEAKDAAGRRRLEQPNDYVRLEIATALKAGKFVIPLLINRAAIPRADDLPSDVAPLARRNALELVDRYWKWGVAELVEALEGVVGSPVPVESNPVPTPAESSDELEAQRAKFHRKTAVKEFLAAKHVPASEKEVAELERLRSDEPLLEAIAAQSDSFLYLDGVLAATPTRLIYVMDWEFRVKTTEFPYNQLARVYVDTGKRRDDFSVFIPRTIYWLVIETYTEKRTRYRLETGQSDELRALLNAVHTRTDDGVVNLELPPVDKT